MKVSIYTKIISAVCLFSSVLLAVSCGTTQEIAQEQQAVAEVTQSETKPVEAKSAVDESELEYLRSIGDINVSKDTFEHDKAKVLRLITELSDIMRDYNFKPWLSYLDTQSIEYWSKLPNLRKAQGRLPVKGLQLKSMEDYFRYVFVPARSGHTVKEIRYESDTSVKVVDIVDEEDIIYYYFHKIDGVWMLHLPPMDK